MGDATNPRMVDTQSMGRFRVLLVVISALAAVVLPAQAFAAKMIARGAKNVSLKARVTDSGDVALITYTAGGSVHHTLVWGAVDGASNPNEGGATKFNVNYSGGYGSQWGNAYWKKIQAHNECSTYKGRGPAIHLASAGCALPDGTFFLVQSWIGSEVPDNGWKPSSKPLSQIWVSHFHKQIPQFVLADDWVRAQGQWRDHVYGELIGSDGSPVYGGASTSRGNPTDGFGRLISIDTLRPPWSTGFRQSGGWYRYNSFLTHKKSGVYCDGIYKTISGVRARSIAGKGKQYRAIVNGPGVSPVMYRAIASPGKFNSGRESAANSQLDGWMAARGDNTTCR
jgi:hypothetical protein